MAGNAFCLLQENQLTIAYTFNGTKIQTAQTIIEGGNAVKDELKVKSGTHLDDASHSSFRCPA